MRLWYASIALLLACVVACQPAGITAEQAVDVAKSHMLGEPQVQSIRSGPLSELAPVGLEIEDPNERVWAITLRGTFLFDCQPDAAGNQVCPPEPRTGLIILDYFTGGIVGFSINRIVPQATGVPHGTPAPTQASL